MKLLLVAALTGSFHIEHGYSEDLPSDKVYTVAVLPFDTKGDHVDDLGPLISELIFKELSKNDGLLLVDLESASVAAEKAALERTLDVDVGEVSDVGLSVGAQIVIAGAAVETGDATYLMARVISADHDHVVDVNVKGSVGENLAVLTEGISRKIGDAIDEHPTQWVLPPDVVDEQLAGLKARLKGFDPPSIRLRVQETHVGDTIPPQLAEGKIKNTLMACGISVTSAEPNEAETGLVVDVMVVSELALRRRDVVSVRGWLEYKVVDAVSNRVLAKERQFSVGVATTEIEATTAAILKVTTDFEKRLVGILASPGH